VTSDRERILVAVGGVGRARGERAIVESTEIELAKRQQRDQSVSELVPCLIGIRLSPRICETSPRVTERAC